MLAEKILFLRLSLFQKDILIKSQIRSRCSIGYYIKQDPYARVACEVFTTTNTVIVGGEISTTVDLDIEKIARETLLEIGYTDDRFGIDGRTCDIQVLVHTQSPDIAMGVDRSSDSWPLGQETKELCLDMQRMKLRL